MQTAEDYDEACARLEKRDAIGKAAWRLLMPPVAANRRVTVLIMDEFIGTSLMTMMQASADNRTSVIAIAARDFSPDTAEGRVMALARGESQSVIKFQGSLWADERGQACVVFHDEGHRARMRIGHNGHLKVLDGAPTGDFEAGVRTAATRLLSYTDNGQDVPGCVVDFRLAR